MNREKCPCCGYPTLEIRNDYEICILCMWEDDGQGNSQAAEVWGGPNGNYSLEEARINFEKNLIMYRDGDVSITDKEKEQKRRLMEAYEKYETDHTESWNDILLLEDELRRFLWPES